MDIIFEIIVCNVFVTSSIFFILWLFSKNDKFLIGKNLSKKLSNIDNKIDSFSGEFMVGNDIEEKVLLEIKEQLSTLKSENLNVIHEKVIESSVRTQNLLDKHEEYHSEILEKLNKAGEVII